MRVTKDRLAVARAVHEQTMMRVVCHRHGINASVVHSSKIDLEAIIAAIPEPEPQIKYGCHCDIENTVSGEPDDCVFDNGDVDDCIYAVKLQREGKGKLACEFWKPINPPAEPPDDSPATLPAPTGPDMCAQNAAHTGHNKTEWWWARERKTKVWHMARVAFPRPSPRGDDVLIASTISGFSNTLRNRRDFDAWLPLVAPTAKGGVE